MPRKSTTPMVILGLLSTEPMSGYDIKATIDRSIGHFWNESYGQLYPALKRLHADGLVDKSERADGGRTSHVYSITDAGRAALDAWLDTPPRPRIIRNELLLRVFFGHQTPTDSLLTHLSRELAEARGMGQALSGVCAELERTCADDPELPYWLLTLDMGRRNAQARAEWAAHAIETLGRITEEQS